MRHQGFGFLTFLTLGVGLALYFGFAAVQGDLGIMRRLEIEAEIAKLEARRDALEADVTALENKTNRLSDDYLDLDLLDERARAVLGVVRRDEIVVR